ncbi:MAG: outer membrane beta-barrel protein [Proteobacteria bacterium]|nr:outer membrane beta-barrel protein [Pseudomonadota bacterium]
MTSKKLIILIVTIFSFIMISSGARSDEFKIIPSVTALEEYNSNVFFTSYEPESDFITTFSPAFELVNRTERSNANIKVRLDLIGYADNRDLNATDQLYQGKLRYNITPRFGISADVGYLSDSRPDRDLETTGLITSDLRRDRVNTALSTDYQFTEQDALSLSYAYSKETFDKEGYSDTLTHEFNAGLTHDFNKYVPALKGYLGIGYSNYDFSDNQMDITSGTVGLSQALNELWSVGIYAGLRYAESEILTYRLEPVLPPFLYQRVAYKETEDAWGWLGKVSLIYNGESGYCDISYIREIRPSSFYGVAMERNSLELYSRYKMTYELSADLHVGYFANKTDKLEFYTQNIDKESYYINPRISYNVSKDISVEAKYKYSLYNDNTADTEADRHLFSIRLYIQHSLLE